LANVIEMMLNLEHPLNVQKDKKNVGVTFTLNSPSTKKNGEKSINHLSTP
jgi:hypothetical protein